MSNLWQSREQASGVLAEKAPEVLAVLSELFGLVDECAEAESVKT